MKKYLMLFFVALTLGFQACDNNDDLWDAIDDLKSRVQALETQVNALNGNIETLQKLYSGATITSVTQLDGKYVLLLSNGEKVELEQGSTAQAVMPVIGIDEDGYWQVSYDGGATFQKLGVKADAADGMTPRFRVDETTGYWQVSYDGGATFENVLDTKNQPVKAIGAGMVTDKFFETARVENGEFYLKLLDGTELRIPILSDFYCRIIVDVEGVQTFDAGASKRFRVEIKGVENTIVTAPEGWQARLSDPVGELAELVVTAPGGTRATADSSKDVTILATAGKFAAIAKIEVQSSGVAPTPPTVAVANSTSVAPTQTTLTFDVTLSPNAESWKYICRKSAEAAPDADEVLADGVTGIGTSVTVEGLEAATAYTLYVVAVAGELHSDVQHAGNTTAAEQIDPNDYYAAGVEVGGVRYDRNSAGAGLIAVAADATADVDIPVTTGGVFFIDDMSDTYMAGTAKSVGVVKDVVIIGRYAAQKTELMMKQYWALRNPGGLLAFKNVKIDAVGIGNYLFNATDQGVNTGGMGTLLFEDCEIAFDKAFLTMYNAAASTGIGNIVFRRCKLRYEGTAGTYAFITLQKTDAGLDLFRSLVFENNIIYSTAGASTPSAVSLFYQDNAATQASLTGSLANLSIKVTNNTLVDFISFGSGVGSAYFHVAKIGQVEFLKNLLYSNRTDKYVSVMRVLYDYNANGPWPAIDLGRLDNKVYGTSGWKLYYDASGAVKPEGTNTYPKLADNPLTTCDTANGVFVKDASVAEYGSTLE